MKYTLDATDYTDFRAIIDALAELPYQDETTGARIFSAVWKSSSTCNYCERDVRVLEMSANMIKNCLREAEKKEIRPQER